ncbi:MAG: hypothetical protein ACKPKO_46540, partial [Candidatus Fonsibacter sp.]
ITVSLRKEQHSAGDTGTSASSTNIIERWTYCTTDQPTLLSFVNLKKEGQHSLRLTFDREFINFMQNGPKPDILQPKELRTHM